MNELGEAAEVLSISAPGGPSTKHLVDKSVIGSLGANGVLVNVGRGSIVDTRALVEALESDGLAGAGLDTLEGDDALRERLCRLDNVILTPHVAGSTFEANERKSALTRKVLSDYFAGHPVPNRVV